MSPYKRPLANMTRETKKGNEIVDSGAIGARKS